jgi:glucosylceramidase
MNVTKLLAIPLAFAALSCTRTPAVVEFVSTTESSYWETCATPVPSERQNAEHTPGIIVDTMRIEQTIDGFGSCFNELGALSLIFLDQVDRDSIMDELFTPGKGANFTICRTPVGANDFSRDWYSYNETERDFDMNDFSIANDREMLIPFIKQALGRNPNLKIWASPWSPPSWMKHNKHYASRPLHTPEIDNGLAPEQEGFEGTDMFIREDAYLRAYALYFSKYIEEYRKEGINIFAIMPQNEFNSAQVFPSCCWTAAGLANFIGEYLGPAMSAQGVDIMFGTMERPNEALVDTILNDPKASQYIKGAGFQWAGKHALPGIHKRYPNLLLYQTEQECGNGKNDWKGAIYSWNLMKHYLDNGVSTYLYWNTSLPEGAPSRWGWKQNSLVTVKQVENTENFSWRYTPEYYILKHASHYVMPSARKIELSGDYGDALAFINPDKSVIVIAANQTGEDKTVSIALDNRIYLPLLKANSLNTLVIRNK